MTADQSIEGVADRLTGAEAVAQMLAEAGIRRVFAYPGTSELALCDAVDQRSELTLVNGRGDAESVFLAAGANLMRPSAAAIVHGARGLTNACGAIADARRNEIPLVVLVGLPSTSSQRFLPPHGERDLLAGAGTFAKHWWEASAGVDPRELVNQIRKAFAVAAAAPPGVVLVGLPQDLLQERWLPPLSDWPKPYAAVPAFSGNGGLEDEVAAALRAADHPLILVDDYLLRVEGAQAALDDFSWRLGAPVLQLRYTRGPMLFERVDPRRVRLFRGWYDPTAAEHRALLAEADLLVTVEDRNLYQRVVGPLPPCRKIAITSHPAATRKNEYLGANDVLLEGNAARWLAALAGRLGERAGSVSRTAAMAPADTPPAPVGRSRRQLLVGALADGLRGADSPVIVDDSQMLGGLIAAEYDLLPPGLRIRGDHGGFVGAGLGYAAGLALADPEVTVLATVGDQAFTNGMQALVAAGEQCAPLTVLLCNNGETVSLRKQADFDGHRLAGPDRSAFLGNAATVNYAALAVSLGVRASRVEWRSTEPPELAAAADQLSAALRSARAARVPQVIELMLPGLGDAWSGVWETAGREPVSRTPSSSAAVPRPVQVGSREGQAGPG